MDTTTMFSSKNHDWRTPPALFALLDRTFAFTLDAAASDENHLCPTYFTEKEERPGAAMDRPCVRQQPIRTYSWYMVQKGLRGGLGGS